MFKFETAKVFIYGGPIVPLYYSIYLGAFSLFPHPS